MQTYGHFAFEELLTDEENNSCFDCSKLKFNKIGKIPAQWASVNNAIYLCLNCSGEHRGYGVSTSFMRSITIDTW
jgi:ADP-ribosylation factor GTPase-activating protein 1